MIFAYRFEQTTFVLRTDENPHKTMLYSNVVRLTLDINYTV